MLRCHVKTGRDSGKVSDTVERPRRWITRAGVDVVTWIVGLNVLVFGYMLSLAPGESLTEFIQKGSLSVKGLQSGAWWQPVTHLFLHGGDTGGVMRLAHLALNMLVVYHVGKELLAGVGTKHWLGIYFFSGILGGFLQILVTPDSPLLGASGSAFGLLAAYCSIHAFELLEAWVWGFRVRINGGAFVRALIISSILLGLIALTSAAFIPLISNIGHFAHLGGALGGVLYVRLSGFYPRSLTKADLLERRAANDARLDAGRTSPQV